MPVAGLIVLQGGQQRRRRRQPRLHRPAAAAVGRWRLATFVTCGNRALGLRRKATMQ